MMIDEIAKNLGVSATTVSRAISGNGRVSEKTRARILEYTAEIGYVPNEAARNLRTTKTRNIAFSLPLDLSGDATRFDYFLECLVGVNKVAAEASYDVFIVGAEMEQLSRTINSRKADGVILTRTWVGDANLEKLAQASLPIVLTGTTSVPNITKVGYDRFGAARELTLRLMNSWDGDIGLIVSNRAWSFNQWRVEGFTDAFAARNKPAPVVIWDVSTKNDAQKAFDELYGKGIRNIICGDDTVCLNLMSVAKARNVNIASFHSSHYLRDFYPEIPAVDLAAEKLGAVACRMLIDRIEGGVAPEETLLDYSLRV